MKQTSEYFKSCVHVFCWPGASAGRVINQNKEQNLEMLIISMKISNYLSKYWSFYLIQGLLAGSQLTVNIAIVMMEAAKYIFHDLYTNERFKNNQKQKMINNCIVWGFEECMKILDVTRTGFYSVYKCKPRNIIEYIFSQNPYSDTSLQRFGWTMITTISK